MPDLIAKIKIISIQVGHSHYLQLALLCDTLDTKIDFQMVSKKYVVNKRLILQMACVDNIYLCFAERTLKQAAGRMEPAGIVSVPSAMLKASAWSMIFWLSST